MAINAGHEEHDGVSVLNDIPQLSEWVLKYDEVSPLFKQVMAEVARVSAKSMFIIHYMHDKYYYEKSQMHKVKAIIPFVDLFLVDIKHINPERHKKITWQSLDPVRNFINYLEEHKKKMWIRYVLVPWYTDQEDFVHELGQTYGAYTQIQRIEILPYHELGVYKWKELWRKYPLEKVWTMPFAQIEQVKKIFQQYFTRVVVRR